MLSFGMEGSVRFGRCGRLVPAMTRCECVEMTFDELTRRLREQQASLDAVQAETGVGLLCTACLPDLREHLSTAGEAVPPETPSSLGPAEPREGDEPADAGSGSPVLAAAHEAR